MTRFVLQLTNQDSSLREQALLELSKKREDFPDLPPMLWHSFGTIASLLQNNRHLSIAVPTDAQCNRVESSLQRTRALTVCRFARRYEITFFSRCVCVGISCRALDALMSGPPSFVSAHPAVPVPLPKYGEPKQAFRVPSL